MDLERLKQAWNEQGKLVLLSKDPLTMIADIRRQRASEWPYLAMIGAGIALAAVFAFWGPPWLAKKPLLRYASSVPFLFMSLFLFLDALRHRKQKTTARSVTEELDIHLGQITREIRLGRSIVWWMLLPTGVAVQIILTAAYIQILCLEDWAFPLAAFVAMNAFSIAFFYSIYRFYQFDVKGRLQLRKTELENMLRDLLKDRQTNDESQQSK